MEGLVDLSLFEWNPTGNSGAQGVSSGSAEYYQPALSGMREFYAPSPTEDIIRETEDMREAMRRSIHDSFPRSEPRYDTAIAEESGIRETIVDAGRRREIVMKPLPSLPRTRICQQIADDGSQCILKRIKRAATEQSLHSPGSLLQRRNANAPPQLTLSVPHESPRPQNNTSNRIPSPMVWMPDEQMWLVVGEPERRPSSNDQAAYPTPPAYTPRVSTRSEPASRTSPQWDLTPPQTPIQSQLQSLLQPRDEERLSPLFQEAMNSVPMTDNFDLPPPPSYEGSVGRVPFPQLRPHTSVSERYPPHNTPSPHRSQTLGSQRPRVRSDTSADRSSGHGSFSSLNTTSSRQANNSRGNHSTSSSQSFRTAPEETPTSTFRPIAFSTRSWHGLAQRLARPKSTL